MLRKKGLIVMAGSEYYFKFKVESAIVVIEIY
jgi:hypothetical protein